ncbi:RNA polymerase RpoH-like sigma 32 subunit [Dongia mobilis]|uniref:RNA polymerase sigma factor RpoH n=1 Tax=Dongia mobilis TaxID=578943 RepID=A0A4R6WNM4_9PROT|nr:RNA polymerase sigma factor RpoH [Dongia mobilis]TDQ80494.1 RNA polymerase RpoH-like sigma 32 subunit [Dongia mobilis]
MASGTTTLPALVGENSLGRYLSEIRKFPMLEPDEEFMLAKRWQEHQDPDAAHRMVTSHLRLVAKIAMGYRGYGLPMSEVISEGNVGLMQAVKRFDPDRGFRLATYAMWWIRAAIQEYILHSWSLVKIGTTASQKKLFFNLRRVKGQIKALEEGDMSPENVKEIATRLNVSEEEVINMNRRLMAPDHSLNAPLRIDGEGEWQDWLVDETESQETRVADNQEFSRRKKLLDKAMLTLTPRERKILVERRLKDEPTTLEDLSTEFGISRERVRQIEVRAFDKLQRSIRKQAIDEKLIGEFA